jgi:uncharacterized protein YbbK (DUF523 family)
MPKILVSECLLGGIVRYDGKAIPETNPLLSQWHRLGYVVPICPEVAGGLAVPRDPAEISSEDGGGVLDGRSRVLSISGKDVTPEFIRGAQIALARALEHNIEWAVFKSNSPSCGNLHIYDGSFSGKRKAGPGVTAALLLRHGIRVFNENQLDDLLIEMRVLSQ